jgi:hypothetical protein
MGGGLGSHRLLSLLSTSPSASLSISSLDTLLPRRPLRRLAVNTRVIDNLFEGPPIEGTQRRCIPGIVVNFGSIVLASQVASLGILQRRRLL